jgi:hypothetical protein
MPVFFVGLSIENGTPQLRQSTRARRPNAAGYGLRRSAWGDETCLRRHHAGYRGVTHRTRDIVLWTLAALSSVAILGAVQLTGLLDADAANCHNSSSCAPQSTPKMRPRTARPRVAPAPPTTAEWWPAATSTTTAPTTSTPTTTASPIRAVADPTGCTGIIGGIVWPPAWRVRCAGHRPGLLGSTNAGVTTLFVRTGETPSRLRVVALHEAGHAWDLARLNQTSIERWCAERRCDAPHFFSGGASGPGWYAPGGAEDWAASWDACHGGEYHRSYIGLAAPTPSQCAMQNTLVHYPG